MVNKTIAIDALIKCQRNASRWSKNDISASIFLPLSFIAFISLLSLIYVNKIPLLLLTRVFTFYFTGIVLILVYFKSVHKLGGKVTGPEVRIF